MAILVTITGRAARLPDRLLHGPRRVAARAGHARRRGRSCRSGRPTSSRSTPGGSSCRATVRSTGSSGRSGSRRPGLDELSNAVARPQLSLAAVHDPADLRGPGADPDLAPRGVRRPRRPTVDDLPPGRSCRSSSRPLVAGSIFTFSLTLGDYITPDLGRGREVHRQRRSTTTRPRATCRSRPPTRCSRSSS